MLLFFMAAVFLVALIGASVGNRRLGASDGFDLWALAVGIGVVAAAVSVFRVSDLTAKGLLNGTWPMVLVVGLYSAGLIALASMRHSR